MRERIAGERALDVASRCEVERRERRTAERSLRLRRAREPELAGRAGTRQAGVECGGESALVGDHEPLALRVGIGEARRHADDPSRQSLVLEIERDRAARPGRACDLRADDDSERASVGRLREAEQDRLALIECVGEAPVREPAAAARHPAAPVREDPPAGAERAELQRAAGRTGGAGLRLAVEVAESFGARKRDLEADELARSTRQPRGQRRRSGAALAERHPADPAPRVGDGEADAHGSAADAHPQRD